MIHLGPLLGLQDLYDGTAGVVVLHDATWSPPADMEYLDTLDGELGRQAVTLTADIVGGVLVVDWEEAVSFAAPGASVGGWVLAHDIGADAVSPVLKSGAHPGGDPPDPYTVTLAGGAMRFTR